MPTFLQRMAAATLVMFAAQSSLASGPLGFYPNPEYNIAWSVSDDGQILMWYTRFEHVGHDFLWSFSHFDEQIDSIGGEKISGDGNTVVGRGPLGASRWTRSLGHMVSVPAPSGGLNSYCKAVSYDGTAIAGYDSTSGSAWRWTLQNGTVSIVSPGRAFDISGDGNIVVGDTSNLPFIFEAGVGVQILPPLPGFIQSTFSRISGDGMVVAGDGHGFGPYTGEAFRWTRSGGYSSLGTLPHLPDTDNNFFRVTAINRDGSIICGNQASRRAWIWDAVHGMRDLRDVLMNDFGYAGLEGARILFAEGISADGTIVVGKATFDIEGPDSAFFAIIPCRSDLNRDGAVDFFDYLDFVAALADGSGAAEFNGDHTIDFFDYLDFVASFASGC